MLQTGWIEAARLALLALGVSALTACGMLGGAGESRASGAGSELQPRYDALLSRLKAGDATATTELEEFSALHPDLAGPLLNLGIARARAGDDVGALDFFERATRVCSRCGPAWNELGVLHRKQGRFAAAEQAYLQAIRLEATYAPAHYNVAVLYEIYTPRPDLALQYYERYLQLGAASREGDDVEKWVADLRRRTGATAKTANAEGAP